MKNVGPSQSADDTATVDICTSEVLSLAYPFTPDHFYAKTQGDDPQAAVAYTFFEKKMLEIMASRAWDPDPPEVLLQVDPEFSNRSNDLLSPP